MKKVVLCLLAFTFVFSASDLFGQGAADLKAASKALTNYKYDREKNAAEIVTAATKIESALKDGEVSSKGKSWLTKGEIFKELSSNEFYSLKYPDAALNATNAYKKALDVCEKKFEINEAVTGLAGLGEGLNKSAANKLDKKDYEGSYNNLNALLDIKSILDEKGKGDMLLAKAEDLSRTEFFTAYTARLAGKEKRSATLFEKLAKSDFAKEEPSIFVNLYLLNEKTDEDKAIGFLKQGREIFPEDQTLLLNIAQHYLNKNDLAGAESALSEAIAKDPDNAILITSLGKVYDDLYQKDDKFNPDYFKSAEKYYVAAIEKKGDHIPALYNLGALYFNATKPLREKMNNLPMSADKEYNQLKEEVNTKMKQALPYFEKVEALDANDKNTVIALKEVHAALGDAEKSSKYKKKLDTMKGGK